MKQFINSIVLTDNIFNFFCNKAISSFAWFRFASTSFIRPPIFLEFEKKPMLFSY